MTASDIADAADRSPLWRLFRSIAAPLLVTAIAGLSGAGLTLHKSQIEMQASLDAINVALTSLSERLAIASARQGEIETRLRIMEMEASGASVAMAEMSRRLSKIEETISETRQEILGELRELRARP